MAGFRTDQAMGRFKKPSFTGRRWGTARIVTKAEEHGVDRSLDTKLDANETGHHARSGDDVPVFMDSASRRICWPPKATTPDHMGWHHDQVLAEAMRLSSRVTARILPVALGRTVPGLPPALPALARPLPDVPRPGPRVRQGQPSPMPWPYETLLCAWTVAASIFSALR